MFDKLNITPSELMEQLKKCLEGIHPDILAADADELIAAGWGDMPRRRIPLDWRTKRPDQRSAAERRETRNGRLRQCCKCVTRDREECCTKCNHRHCQKCRTITSGFMTIEAEREYNKQRYRDGKVRPAKYQCCQCTHQTRGRKCQCSHERCVNCLNVRRDGTLALPRHLWERRGQGHYPNQRFDVQGASA